MLVLAWNELQSIANVLKLSARLLQGLDIRSSKLPANAGISVALLANDIPNKLRQCGRHGTMAKQIDQRSNVLL